MSAELRFWDRLGQRDLPGPPEESLPGGILLYLGEWALVNGVQAASGDFLLPDSEGKAQILLPEAEMQVQQAGLQDDFPGRDERQAFLAACSILAELEKQAAGFQHWLAISPLVVDLPEKANLRPFEIKLQEYFWHVQRVCAQPRTQLTLEIELMPVSRARRIPHRAFERLANHTEDWEYRKLRSVVPRRILSTLPEDWLDFYENRLTACLVQNVDLYLLRRLEELKRLNELRIELELGSHKRQQRVFKLLGAAFSKESLRKSMEPTGNVLQRLYQQNLQVQDLPLYAQITPQSRSRVLPEVRTTNILTNDRHYRFVNLLWKQFLQDHYTHPQTAAEIQRELQQFCQAFDRYCVLLVCRALAELGFGASADAPLQRGATLELDSKYAQISLAWAQDGSLHITRNGSELLHIVPLAAGLTRGGDPSRAVRQFNRALHALETPQLAARTRKEAQLPSPRLPVLVFYPGMRSERLALPGALQRQLNSPGNDLARPRQNGFIPLSPYELGCVERVGRALRWAIFKPLYLAYPPVVHLPVQYAADLLETAPWLKKDAHSDEARLLRWVQTGGSEMREHLKRWGDLRGGLVSKGKAKQQEVDLLDQYKAEFEHALIELEQLRRCPVCGHLAQPENFHPEGENVFSCNCEQHNCASWGLKICGQCKQRYPYLKFGKPAPSVDFLADWVDRQLGMDVLAAPCPGGEEVFICPNCGSCGQSAGKPVDHCANCRAFRSIQD